MRLLLVLRGLPGCGKSTWIKEHELDQYTLSADNIRLLYGAPEQLIDGRYYIPNKFDRRVWAFLEERLEERMQNGDTTVIDAMHLKESYLTKYKALCKKYKYRMIVVDFTNIDLEEVLSRNEKRDYYKRVDPEAIKALHTKMINNKLQGNYEIYNYEDAFICNLNNFIYTVNGGKYNKVVVFGDIHGCYDPLKEYFNNNPESEDNLYVFVGDYFDRGIQNKEVLQFCLDHCEKDNFIFLEGNHEKWMQNYIKDGMEAKMTPEFKLSLEQFGELKSKLSTFAKRLKLQIIVNFNKKHNFYVTHAGLSIPTDYRVSANQCIKGVGSYEDLDKVEQSFNEINENGIIRIMGITCYNVHGHRNINKNPTYNEDIKSINLEGKVEFGGHLRIVELSYTDKMNINPIEIKNNTFKQQNTVVNISNKSIISELDHSDLIHKKDLGDGIASYNFSREAFYSQKWNKLTTTARGLFVNTNTYNVVARSYPKFFEAEQHPTTEWRNLKSKLKFPVTAYLKENGFLGIVSVYNNELFIASKSTNQGEFKENFERILRLRVNCDKLKDYLSKNNCSAIFECVDPYNDPHIINYINEKVVLLDIVQNDFTDTFKSYDEVKTLADTLGCICKNKARTFNTFDELKTFIDDYDNSKAEIEGFVFVDSNNFMFKYKTPYYKFWKNMRKLKEFIVNGKIDKINMFKNIPDEWKDLAQSVYQFMIDLKASNLESLSIIDIRNLYLENNL